MNTMNTLTEKPIAPTLKNMEVGDKECFPIERLLVVKSTITLIGRQMRRVYQTDTTTSREHILVTRKL